MTAGTRTEGNKGSKGNIGVYALCPFAGKWINQQLLKDCGLVPYMLHKTYGYDAVMVGVRHGEYPYLEQYLHGMRMDFYPDCRDEDDLLRRQIRYVAENHRKMDVMILNGPYPQYRTIIPEYRKLRPDGRIFLGLDANSGWMDRIDPTDPPFMRLLDTCDVIATSCRKMQQHLARKWPRWKIEYAPNGFFNTTGREIHVSPEDKENILLTVGRIGTEQKANHILLKAFARVHKKLPDWSVRLVGSVDEGFKPYIKSYFERYPQLKKRVLFTGLIESKELLYEEYRKAKVFILTSIFEGGAPNVVAEALFHGCYTVTSDIDASEDITDGGAIGRVFPINDIDALAEVLLETCAGGGRAIHGKTPDILSYARNNFDWELIIKRLHHLLFEV